VAAVNGVYEVLHFGGNTSPLVALNRWIDPFGTGWLKEASTLGYWVKRALTRTQIEHEKG
jgi:hypothetical protein